jgi:hypothetical protein
VLQLPKFCVAPDGTILWPYTMDCGCRLIEMLKETDPTFINALVAACPAHAEKSQRIAAEDDSELPKKYALVNNEYLPRLTTDEL